MTKRINAWNSALASIVMQRMSEPFAWGSNDCCTFAADCVAAVTGEDPMEALRGTYHDESSAAEVIAANGGLGTMVAAAIGEEVYPPRAQPGDVVLTVIEGREMLGVVFGTNFFIPGTSGLVALPMSRAKQAWRCATE